MNKICRRIGSVAIFVICVFSATNAGAATIAGEVEQEWMWLGRHMICGKVYELDNKELMLEFTLGYSQYIARQYGITTLDAATITSEHMTPGMALGAQQQQSQPVDCDKVNSEVMKLYSLAGLSKDSVAKAQQAGEQKRQAEEQKRQAEEQKRQAEEQQQKRQAEEQQQKRQAKKQKRQAEEQQQKRQAALKRQEIEKTLSTNSPNSIGMKFVQIPAGSFVTGAGKRESTNAFGEKETITNPGWKVTISKPFYLGQYEVTQEQWHSVIGDNPSQFKGRTNPVENVSWTDAQAFIMRLNQKEGHDGYRLPTEAEWEYAARAGTQTNFFFSGDRKTITATDVAEYAWFKDNSGQTTHPVGQKKPNPWALYDIYGNVWEWVQDGYSEKYYGNNAAASTDPFVSSSGSPQVIRGGSWYGRAEFCSSVYRHKYKYVLRFNNVGFRLAFSPE